MACTTLNGHLRSTRAADKNTGSIKAHGHCLLYEEKLTHRLLNWERTLHKSLCHKYTYCKARALLLAARGISAVFSHAAPAPVPLRHVLPWLPSTAAGPRARGPPEGSPRLPAAGHALAGAGAGEGKRWLQQRAGPEGCPPRAQTAGLSLSPRLGPELALCFQPHLPPADGPPRKEPICLQVTRDLDFTHKMPFEYTYFKGGMKEKQRPVYSVAPSF